MKKALPAGPSPNRKKQRGAVIILVALLMVVFLGIAALVIDLSAQYVVSNELQNAADAGALAGARELYLDSGAVNYGANQVAYEAAKDNIAIAEGGAVAVDVNWNGGNDGDVQRGHWSFETREFTPNSSLETVDLWNLTTEELDDPNTGFINAVRVVTRRGDGQDETPAPSFFARIFGHQNFVREASAVAYIGFAGTLMPHEAEQPIAICLQSLREDDGTLSCNTGRMINSGGGTTTNTAGWTNFSQPCATANPPSVNPLICSDGNPDSISLGTEMGTTGGMQDNVFNNLRDCWMNSGLLEDWRGYPRETWGMTLSVIDCPSNNVGNCSTVVGAVKVDVVWIKQSGADPNWTDIPLQMRHVQDGVEDSWKCSTWVALGEPADINALTETERQGCWQEFADHFNLKTYDDTSVGDLEPSDIQKTVLFLPSCEPQVPAGLTGGENFGVLAKIPVLVQ